MHHLHVHLLLHLRLSPGVEALVRVVAHVLLLIHGCKSWHEVSRLLDRLSLLRLVVQVQYGLHVKT
jgi:hypothetical protein